MIYRARVWFDKTGSIAEIAEQENTLSAPAIVDPNDSRRLRFAEPRFAEPFWKTIGINVEPIGFGDSPRVMQYETTGIGVSLTFGFRSGAVPVREILLTITL